MRSCSWPSARDLRALAVAGGVLILAVSCGSGSGTPTSSSGNTPPLAPNPCSQSQGCPSIDSIGFWIRIQANTNGAPGPWSFTFNEKDFNGSGNSEYGFVNAQPGDYEIRGQFSTTAFNVELGRQSGGRGGVLVSSVQSPEGPSTPSNQCSVNYFTQAAPTTPQTFRVKFTVVTGTNGTC